MTMIDIDAAIESTLERLNRDAGGDAACYVVETSCGAALYTRTWSGAKDLGMVEVYHDDADDAADVLGLDSGLYYAWVTGPDGDPTLAAFDSSSDRDTWRAQV